jgi:hypothetical protein
MSRVRGLFWNKALRQPVKNRQLDEGLKNPMKVTLILSRVIWR